MGTALWQQPYGNSYYIDDAGRSIQLDWLGVDLTSTTAPVEGIIPITDAGGVNPGNCGSGGGIGSCQNTPTVYIDITKLTFAQLGFPPDTGVKGYQNDCSIAGNNCEKIDANAEIAQNGGIFSPGNDPNVVVIKAGQGQFVFVPKGNPCVSSITASSSYCVDLKGDGTTTVVRIGVTGLTGQEISNIQFWHNANCGAACEFNDEPDPDTSLNCPDVFVSPGVITVSSSQIAPNAALVVGQDLDENGVTLQWNISVDPTFVTYQRWEVLGREKTACVQGVSTDSNYLLECGTDICGCATGWHAVMQDVWGCKDKFKMYQESLVELSPGAKLKPGSRAWINGELASAYPGAHLKNPDWAFDPTPLCVWNGSVCTMEFTMVIPASDPLWYDIKLVGKTTGTLASPPRSFDVVAGNFWGYLIDSTTITN